MNLRREMRAYTRACEELLSVNGKLTDDERSLLEYYMNELSRELLADKPIVRLHYNETVSVERSLGA
jgi:hypothetical protein